MWLFFSRWETPATAYKGVDSTWELSWDNSTAQVPPGLQEPLAVDEIFTQTLHTAQVSSGAGSTSGPCRLQGNQTGRMPMPSCRCSCNNTQELKGTWGEDSPWTTKSLLPSAGAQIYVNRATVTDFHLRKRQVFNFFFSWATLLHLFKLYLSNWFSKWNWKKHNNII